MWDEEHIIEDFEQGEDLEFCVMDYDQASAADLLGRVTLRAREFDRHGGFSQELSLKQCGAGCRAFLLVTVEVLPPLRPSMAPVSEPGGRLQVTIFKPQDCAK